MGKLDKLVHSGRVAFIANGKDSGSICAIVEVIDQNRALVDGPCSGVRRQAVELKRLHLTRFQFNLPHSARSAVVKRKWEAAQISQKWSDTDWAKKLEARKTKAAMTDFDRFKLMKAKQARNRIVSMAVGSLRKKVAMKSRKPNKKVHKRAE